MTMKKKQFFLRQGQVSSRIAFIEKGLFRSFYKIHGTETCAWFMREHDIIISVKSFFRQERSMENIQALEDAELYHISYEELNSLYRDFPSFLLTGKLITEHYYVLSEERSYAMRNQRSHERFRYMIDSEPEIVRRVPSKFLASYLGISEVTLSTIKCGVLIDRCSKHPV
jgi:CRP-like cAMP-binding protein